MGWKMTSLEMLGCIRKDGEEMLKMDEYIDVIVPRGGKSLIQRITEESRIPLF